MYDTSGFASSELLERLEETAFLHLGSGQLAIVCPFRLQHAHERFSVCLPPYDPEVLLQGDFELLFSGQFLAENVL